MALTGAVSANIDFRGKSVEVKPRRNWPERELGALAARQRGLITREQLLALGAGPKAVRCALERGRIHPLHRGVYATVPPAALPALAAEQAAVLATSPGGYLSHHSAAAVWGFRPPTAGAIEVTVAGRRPPARDLIRIHRVASIDPRDTRTFRGIPITSPARTLLDIANDLTMREFERAFDEALTSRLITLGAVSAMLRINRDRRGATRTRSLALAGRATTRTRSEAEEMFLALVDRAGLSRPEVNTRIGRFEVDFCWRGARVVVEIDGHAFHSSRAALERDHRRDAELQQMGFLVIRITWRELNSEPVRVMANVAAALARRLS